MNDVADGLLLDVREVGMADPLLDGIGDGKSALAMALNRILRSNVDCNYNSFSSSI
jgi:hypothetical protein